GGLPPLYGRPAVANERVARLVEVERLVFGWVDRVELVRGGPGVEVDESARTATHERELVRARVVLEIPSACDGLGVAGAAPVAPDIHDGDVPRGASRRAAVQPAERAGRKSA